MMESRNVFQPVVLLEDRMVFEFNFSPTEDISRTEWECLQCVFGGWIAANTR
jgi:hypothetical protein